jgi:hypothetical protein
MGELSAEGFQFLRQDIERVRITGSPLQASDRAHRHGAFTPWGAWSRHRVTPVRV